VASDGTRFEFHTISRGARRVASLYCLSASHPTTAHNLEMSTESVSPRVNSARMKNFIGASHPIRLTGKVLNVRACVHPDPALALALVVAAHSLSLIFLTPSHLNSLSLSP
jgi:hypothetical protein